MGEEYLKVKELIDILKGLDQEKRVGVIDHEWDNGKTHGINNPQGVKLVKAGWIDTLFGNKNNFDIYKIQ